MTLPRDLLIFNSVHQKPRVPENVFGKGKIERHQKDGPVDGVKADDILADDMRVGGPVFFEQFAAVAVGVVTESRDIVGQRVQPNVHDVAAVEGNGNAPAESGARNAQILQAGL